MVDVDFDKDKVCYEQNYHQFRSLNNIMWQVPIIAMTLTGGLWFGLQHVPDNVFFKTVILILAAIGNLGLVIVLTRIRYVMTQYLDKLKEFHPRGYVEAKGTNCVNNRGTVMRVFRFILCLSALISLIAIFPINDIFICKKELSADTSVAKQ